MERSLTMQADFVSATQAAEMLDVSRMRVNQMIHEGKLAAQKVGSSWVIERSDVLSLMPKRKPFEDYELEAYLGDFISDYDYDSIVEDSTFIDYSTGNRYWKDGIDLAEICAKHDISST